MTRSVVACSKNDSLERAAELMWEYDVGCVVVTDAAHRPIGIITDRDVAMAAYTQGARLRESRVESAMARHVHLCGVDAEATDVEEIMRSARVRRVPVTNADGEVVGLVTLSDLARLSLAGRVDGVTKTLAAVAGPRPLSIG